MRNSETKRALSMLQSDRIGLLSGAEELIKIDIEALLNEYFCLTEKPRVRILGEKNNLFISVEVNARSVKRFNLVK